MSVQKYKPKATPHALGKQIDDSAAKSRDLISSSKAMIGRSHRLVTAAKKTVQSSSAGRAKRKQSA